jgi:hypothetical protein
LDITTSITHKAISTTIQQATSRIHPIDRAVTMAAATTDALLAAYEAFKSAASPPLVSYAWMLPPLPKGLTLAKLEAAGYPQARDLWDGIALAILLTLARIVLTALVLDRLGRFCMQHRYYQVRSQPVPAIDAVLKCVARSALR